MFTLKLHYRNCKNWQVKMFFAIIFLLFLSLLYHFGLFINSLETSLGWNIFSLFFLIVTVSLRASLSGARRKKFTQFCWLLPLSLFALGLVKTVIEHATTMLFFAIDLLFFKSHLTDQYISKMQLVSEHLTNMSLFFGLNWNPSIGGFVTAHTSLVGCLLSIGSVLVVSLIITPCVYNFCKLVKKVAS